MKDRGFLLVACAIALAIGADIVANQGLATTFLVRKLFQLVEYLAFWR